MVDNSPNAANNTFRSQTDLFRSDIQRSTTTNWMQYGMSTFDTPSIPPRSGKGPGQRDLEPQIMPRERRSREPKVQWQGIRRYGWVDFSADISDKLENSYLNGETVLGFWSGASFSEYDLRDMIQIPGGDKLRRLKYAEPVSLKIPPQEEFAEHGDPELHRCQDVFGFKTPSRSVVRKVDSSYSQSPVEKARARWRHNSSPSLPKVADSKALSR